MLPTPAQYLLRFDDLCPTVSADRWQTLCSLINEFQLKPILAIVPDNQDADLALSPPNPDFWVQMRSLEAAGAATALHGFRHLCLSSGSSLVPLHNVSEFAGVPADTQQTWIRDGIAILRSHGLNPRLWVAPRHGFDHNTLFALRKEGIQILSDGLARIPFTRGGLTWIPQQLWAPVGKESGLWTICIHPNTITDEQVVQLRTFVSLHAAQFTSVERTLVELRLEPLTFSECFYVHASLWRIRINRLRKTLDRFQ